VFPPEEKFVPSLIERETFGASVPYFGDEGRGGGKGGESASLAEKGVFLSLGEEREGRGGYSFLSIIPLWDRRKSEETYLRSEQVTAIP